jgi:predicted GNAT family acetyltransferase
MDGIRIEENEGRGRYVRVLDDGQEVYLTFTRDSAKRMSITYSFVPPAYRGHSLAVPLIEQAVSDARAKGVTIRPTCGYVASVMRRRTQWRDVLAG